MNKQRVIILNDASDVTVDVRRRILDNDLDILQINYNNYNSDDYHPSPFTGMKDLTEIKFKIQLGDNVQSLFGFFYKCESLKSVPLFDTKNVTDMSFMFAFCNSLKTVPLFNTQKVTDMSNMFEHCESLKTVPLFNTQNVNVSSMRYMFKNCPIGI